MKKNKVFLLLVIVLLSILSIGCSSQKAPAKGYITVDEVNEIIATFSYADTPSTYSYKGNLNYFGIASDKVPPTVDIEGMSFVSYPLKTTTESEKNEYLASCASYYLRLPLQITADNWNQGDDTWSTKYQLESKIYRTVGNDSLYYYRGEDGGLIIRAFAVNKELLINNEQLWLAGNCDDLIDIACSGKWNITVVYNAKGLLVKEEFATVNASENNLKESVFGKAEYSYL